MWSFSAVFKVLPLIVIANYVAAIPILPFNETRADDVAYRLPTNSRPITYDLHLTTNVHRGDTKFTGVAIIDVQIVEVTQSIVLHTRQMTVKSVKLTNALNPNEVLSIETSYDSVTEFLEVKTQQTLLVTRLLRLTIEYESNLRTNGGGFYLQSYTNSLGQPVYLATTQFQTTNARHAFPCFDEPQIKSIFRIRITHGKTYNAVSNMPILKIEDNGDGTVTTFFEPTTLMSTYLVAWTVSDYTFTEEFNRIPQRIYSKPNFEKQHKFALDTSIKVLNSLNDYIEVDYPLPKMDSVAIPAKGGAMENWGMVTYGEQYLLYDEAETTTSAKTTIATIISHELAHQWFGNLVGPNWWTYTWLNEGFASFFEYVTTDAVYPEWDIMQAFIASYYRNSLINDARVNPRPMTSYIESPADVAGVFDYVSYGKASNVIRMIQHAFGEKTFRKALHYYQNEMRYRAAVEEDLIAAIKKAALEDSSFTNPGVIDVWIKSWTNQGGYPLITVTRNYDTGAITIKQEPFDGTTGAPPSDTRSWWIPFNFVSAVNPDFSSTGLRGHIPPGTQSITVNQGSEKWTKDDWIIFNPQATSYYRVNYDLENWMLIAHGLRKNYAGVHRFNRAAVIEDAYQLTRARRLTYDVVFELMSYLKDEDQYAPWVIANTIFTTLDNYLSADPDYKTFRFFYKRMTQNFFKKLGIEESTSDKHLDKMIRGSIINLACKANNADCLEATNKRLRAVVEEQKMVEPNLRSAILCTGMMRATEFDMNLLLQALSLTNTQTLRNQILSGMGCMRNSSLITKYLGLSLNPTAGMSNNERLNIVGYVVEKGAAGVKAAIEFLHANYADYDKITNNNPVLSAIRTIANRIFTEDQNKQYEALLDRVAPVVAAESIQGVRNTVQTNLAWTTTNRKSIIDWTSTFYKENDGEKEEEEEGGDGGDGGDGAATIFVSTSVLTIVALGVLRTVL